MEVQYTTQPASPSLSAVDRDFHDDMTDEELDLYFANYVPLSNLPTPPPAKHLTTPLIEYHTADIDSRNSTLRCHDTPELEVQAIHLANLVPNNVSSRRPSTDIILGFLERSKLPTEIVAFAACLLDALSQRFAHAWREKCLYSPLPNPTSSSRKNDFFQFGCQVFLQSEIIVLAALAIAHGFLSDSDRQTQRWVQYEGLGVFTVRELEQTKWCILQDIDYGLMNISVEMVQDILRDMQRAAGRLNTANEHSLVRAAESVRSQKEKEERTTDLKLNIDTYQGAAVWVNGFQTPEPSP